MATEIQEKRTSSFNCTECGAELKYSPGTTELACEYCGNNNEIPVSDVEIKELDFEEYAKGKIKEADKIEEHFIKCDSCGASSTVEPNISSANCPYCSTPLILSHEDDATIIRPESLLPFKLNKEEGVSAFKKWVNGLWFAPNKLKKAALSLDHFKGVYMPHWTYDTDTSSQYTGQRGVHYYVTETYSENGQSKTRQGRKNRWTFVSGNVNNFFDDILIPASNSLPRKYLDNLEPWDLPNLVPFEKSFLSGFITEKYQVDLVEGFTYAKSKAEDHIRLLVRRDIGGDDQRIMTLNVDYKDIKFKHILLPVYVSAYRFKEKLYQFVVNARTGEVQGQRPWSWVKITLAVLGLIAIGATIYFLVANK